jgi:hypothetical protein
MSNLCQGHGTNGSVRKDPTTTGYLNNFLITPTTGDVSDTNLVHRSLQCLQLADQLERIGPGMDPRQWWVQIRLSIFVPTVQRFPPMDHLAELP